MSQSILDILKAAGLDPESPAVAKELGKAAKTVRGNVAAQADAEKEARIATADAALLALVSGDCTQFESLPVVDSAPDQILVRAIRHNDGSRVAVARLKVAGRQAPRFVNLLTDEDCDAATWDAAKRPKVLGEPGDE